MSHAQRARQLLIMTTVLSYLTVGLLVCLGGMKIDLSDVALSNLIIFVLAALGVGRLAARWEMALIEASADCIFYGMLLILPIVISTYLAVQVRTPLADPVLAGIDRALGFDWNAVILWIDARPILAASFHFAYRTFISQLLYVPVLLVLFHRQARAYEMISAYGLLCLTASFISVWWPALGTYGFYQWHPGTLRNVDVTYGFHFMDQFNAVRDDPAFVLRLKESAGIITFPSVHAAVAALCAWATWDVKALRYPFLVLNILMAISAIPEGGHYFADVIAGLGVAGLAIAIVAFLARSKAPSRRFGLKPVV